MVVTHGALPSRHGKVPVGQSRVSSHVTLQTVGVGNPPRTITPGRGGMSEKMASQLHQPRHLRRNGTRDPRSGVAVDATAMMEGRSRGLPCLPVERHLMAGEAKSGPILQQPSAGRESHANDKKEKKPPHHAAPFPRSSHGPSPIGCEDLPSGASPTSPMVRGETYREAAPPADSPILTERSRLDQCHFPVADHPPSPTNPTSRA